MSDEHVVHWQTDVRYGDSRQKDFIVRHPELKGIPGILRKHDLEMPTGERLELKSERRVWYKGTGNCFMETEQLNHGAKERTRKGIYAARDNGCKYFVSFFSDDMEFWFRVDRLIPIVERYAERNKRDEKMTANDSHDTFGFAVPLTELGGALVVSPLEVSHG